MKPSSTNVFVYTHSITHKTVTQSRGIISHICRHADTD